jgi:hypothetical protein
MEGTPFRSGAVETGRRLTDFNDIGIRCPGCPGLKILSCDLLGLKITNLCSFTSTLIAEGLS